MAEALDTLQIADDLESSGLRREHAKAIAHAVHQGRGDLATKSDLAALETRLLQRMSEQATEAAKRETRLLLAMVGTVGVATAILGALITLA